MPPVVFIVGKLRLAKIAIIEKLVFDSQSYHTLADVESAIKFKH